MNVFTANTAKPIILGRRGESGVTTIQFPISSWISRFGQGTFSLTHKRSQGNEYMVPVTHDSENVYWEVSGMDTAFMYYGNAQLSMFIDGKIAKSEVFPTYVDKSIGDPPAPTDGWEEFAERIQTYADTAAEKAAEAENSSIAAGLSAETAGIEASNAETSASNASDSAQAASQSVTDASNAQGAAETAQGKAEDAQGAAETAQGKAEDAQGAAETAQGKAEDAQKAAEAAQAAAEEAASTLTRITEAQIDALFEEV